MSYRKTMRMSVISGAHGIISPKWLSTCEWSLFPEPNTNSLHLTESFTCTPTSSGEGKPPFWGYLCFSAVHRLHHEERLTVIWLEATGECFKYVRNIWICTHSAKIQAAVSEGAVVRHIPESLYWTRHGTYTLSVRHCQMRQRPRQKKKKRQIPP